MFLPIVASRMTSTGLFTEENLDRRLQGLNGNA